MKDKFVTVSTPTFKDEYDKLSPESKKSVEIAREAFAEINNDVFDFESEDRVRKAGYSPQQAEDIAFIIKYQGIKVGQIFKFSDKHLVLTPFKTVVPAQVYLSALQDRLLEVTTIPVETEVASLKKTIQEFTSLTFVGLIKLAFKRLINRG